MLIPEKLKRNTKSTGNFFIKMFERTVIGVEFNFRLLMHIQKKNTMDIIIIRSVALNDQFS